MARETLGYRHPNTLASIGNLGLVLKDKGDLAAAELLLREWMEALRETLGNRHPNTLGSIHNLGLLLKAKGDLAAAELLCREVLEAVRDPRESASEHAHLHRQPRRAAAGQGQPRRR